MTKSELIKRLSESREDWNFKDAEEIANAMLEAMSQGLIVQRRVEIRGFGSFNSRFRKPHDGRNPRTGEALSFDGKYVPSFKPGKRLRTRVNEAAKSAAPARKRKRS